MVLISKIDKKTWDEYVSNLEKKIIIPLKKNVRNYDSHTRKTLEYKKNSALSNSKNRNKKNMKPNNILDLHGYTLHSGRLILNKYVTNCYENNIRTILIITGKGFNNRGVLKEEVPKWLNDNFLKKYLVHFDYAPKNFGGDGALLVRIKNKYKNKY